MQQQPADPARSESKTESSDGADRSRKTDTAPGRSPLDALAHGLVRIGEKFRTRHTLRIL